MSMTTTVLLRGGEPGGESLPGGTKPTASPRKKEQGKAPDALTPVQDSPWLPASLAFWIEQWNELLADLVAHARIVSPRQDYTALE